MTNLSYSNTAEYQVLEDNKDLHEFRTADLTFLRLIENNSTHWEEPQTKHMGQLIYTTWVMPDAPWKKDTLKTAVPIITLDTVLVTTVFISLSQAQTDSAKDLIRKDAHAFVLTSAERHHAGVMQKSEFRNQIKVLAITIFFTIVGIALSRDAKELKGMVLLIAAFVVGFLYWMDTSLYDLSQRELALETEINGYVVQWDALKDTEIDSAVVMAQKKVCETDVWKKIGLLFYPFRANDQLWYAMPVIVGIVIWRVQGHKKK